MADSRMDEILNGQHSIGFDASASRSGVNQSDELGTVTVNVNIEDRFRLLKSAIQRAGLRMWRRRRIQNSVGTGVSSGEPVVDGNGSREVSGGAEDLGNRERIEERGKGCKRERGLLVAMALEMDPDVKKSRKGGGSFYDCNVCLFFPKEPILTCCGHLFCWACFCKLPYVYPTIKECPVCEGEVNDSSIIPIYGDGDSTMESKSESAVIIPPRPKAQRVERVESARQQRVTRGVSHIPVVEALRRIRTSISAMGDSRPEDSSNDRITLATNRVREDGLPRTSRFTRVLSESAASLSSISSALNNAERLVERLETFIYDPRLQRSFAQFLVGEEGDSLTGNATASPVENQISSEEINSPDHAPPSDPTHSNPGA